MTPHRSDYTVGLVASGPNKGEQFNCAYCGRAMPLRAIAQHVGLKHPSRRKCE